MTLKEAFVFKSGSSVSETDAATVLEFAGLNPDAEWNPNDAAAKCKFYDALLGYLAQDNVGVSSVSEGGYSISYDKESKGKHLYRLAQESGCQSLIDKYDSQPIVQNKSFLW